MIYFFFGVEKSQTFSLFTYTPTLSRRTSTYFLFLRHFDADLTVFGSTNTRFLD